MKLNERGRLKLWKDMRLGTSVHQLYVIEHEQIRHKSKIAILDDAHLKVQTLCYFMLKSDWPDGDKFTSV